MKNLKVLSLIKDQAYFVATALMFTLFFGVVSLVLFSNNAIASEQSEKACKEVTKEVKSEILPVYKKKIWINDLKNDL